MNRIVISGRLVADPSLRYTQAGKGVTNFTVAVRRNKETADFIDVVAWDRDNYKLAEICANELAKGQWVTVPGRLQIRSYEDQEGKKRKAAEVIAETVEFSRAKTGTDDLAGLDVGDE
jgi:single-strand DNA-binding protein